MLLWINGPFGGGKTHAADEIGRRLAGSIICDPEHLGYGLHSMMPRQRRSDFQGLAACRLARGGIGVRTGGEAGAKLSS